MFTSTVETGFLCFVVVIRQAFCACPPPPVSLLLCFWCLGKTVVGRNSTPPRRAQHMQVILLLHPVSCRMVGIIRKPSPTLVRCTGLSIKAQATLLELLEAQGLPPLCVTMAVKEQAGRKLGEVMAEAVKVRGLWFDGLVMYGCKCVCVGGGGGVGHQLPPWQRCSAQTEMYRPLAALLAVPHALNALTSRQIAVLIRRQAHTHHTWLLSTQVPFISPDLPPPPVTSSSLAGATRGNARLHPLTYTWLSPRAPCCPDLPPCLLAPSACHYCSPSVATNQHPSPHGR
jgi:hypothetical protein